MVLLSVTSCLQNWFIASLAFADLSLGLIIMPFSLAHEVIIQLNVKALVAASNQEKALVGVFSMITNLLVDLFQALVIRHFVRISKC